MSPPSAMRLAIFFGTWPAITSSGKSAVSIFPNPRFFANLPLPALIAPVKAPDKPVNNDCLPVSNLSSVCCLTPSALEPEPNAPSPIALAINGATFGAYFKRPFAIACPPPITAPDSPILVAMTEGFSANAPRVGTKPLASSTF